jgi:hypothetical protein
LCEEDARSASFRAALRAEKTICLRGHFTNLM